MKLRLWLAALCFGSSCAAPLEDLDLQPRAGGPIAAGGAEAAREATPNLTAEPKPALVARVAGRELGAGELLSSLLGRQPDLVREHLELLVSQQLADLEAQRLGLQLDYDAYEQRCEDVLSELEAGLPRGIELDAWVAGSLGLDPARFRQRLKGDVLRELVTERVVRAWTLTHEHARIRLITAAPGDGPAIAARLAAGESFAAVARDASLGPAPELGGLVPFLPRAEGAPLSALAFRAELVQSLLPLTLSRWVLWQSLGGGKCLEANACFLTRLALMSLALLKQSAKYVSLVLSPTDHCSI